MTAEKIKMLTYEQNLLLKELSLNVYPSPPLRAATLSLVGSLRVSMIPEAVMLNFRLFQDFNIGLKRSLMRGQTKRSTSPMAGVTGSIVTLITELMDLVLF